MTKASLALHQALGLLAMSTVLPAVALMQVEFNAQVLQFYAIKCLTI